MDPHPDPNKAAAAAAAAKHQLWFRSRSDAPLARCHLFLFPFAGGDGDSMFASWQKRLPACVFKVHTLTLPGRGRLREEQFVVSMPEVARRCAEEVVSAVEASPLPVAFFGASLGCLIAYETARLLVERQQEREKKNDNSLRDVLGERVSVVPVHLFVAGHVAPSQFTKHEEKKGEVKISTLPEAEFKAAILRYNLVDEAILEVEEFSSMFLPIIRADLHLDEHYLYDDKGAAKGADKGAAKGTQTTTAQLPCPITAFSAKDDSAAPPHLVQAWSAHTQSGKLANHVTFPAISHEFLLKKSLELMEELSKTLLSGPLMRPWHVDLIRVAKIAPDSPAIANHTGPPAGCPSLSLGEFVRQAHNLANRLWEKGVRAKSHVMLLLPSSYLGVVSMLAVNICGARAVPVNPRALDRDVRQRVADLKPSAIIVSERKNMPSRPLAGWLHDVENAGVLVLRQGEVESILVEDNDSSSDRDESKGIRRFGFGEGEMAYEEMSLSDVTFVSYTSGSTGLPKGMPLTHYNVANNSNWRVFKFPMGTDDTFALSIFWWWYWFVPLVQGAMITHMEPHYLVDVEALSDCIGRRKITSLDLTPSLLGELLMANPNDPNLQIIRRIQCYGEPLTLNVADLFLKHLPNAELINIYSTTENNDLTLSVVTERAVRLVREAGIGLQNAAIGKPLWNVELYLEPCVDEDGELAATSSDDRRETEVFEMFAYGAALPPGYVNRKEANDKAFVTKNGRKMYRCGDLVAMCGDEMVVMGRADQVVNVRGFRVGLETVNETLRSAPGVVEACAVFHKRTNALVAFVVYDAQSETAVDARSLRQALLKTLERPAVPTRFVSLRRLPKTSRGKIDKRTLLRYLDHGVPDDVKPKSTTTSSSKVPNSDRNDDMKKKVKQHRKPLPAETVAKQARDYAAFGPGPPPPSTRTHRTGMTLPAGRGRVEEFEAYVRVVWMEVLGISETELEGSGWDSGSDFFEVGGHSLVAIKLAKRLGITMPQLMAGPTIRQQARLVQAIALKKSRLSNDKTQHRDTSSAYMYDDLIINSKSPKSSLPRGVSLPEDPRRTPIAIVGLAGRWPGCESAGEFWKRLKLKVDCFEDLSDHELRAAGVPSDLYLSPSYVRRSAFVPSHCVENFENEMFGMSRSEARLTDPNQRVLLEVAYESLEDAGYDPFGLGGMSPGVGVFMSGPSLPTYLLNCIKKDISRMMLYEPGEYVRIELGNDKDYIAPRVSFCLGLTGPSRTIQSACSSSLVSVTSAATSIRQGQCAVALAGGISIQCPQKTGYLHQDGMVLSPDGKVRPFDAQARGTIFTNGCTVLVLKRLDQALKDRDNIYAVLRGLADNNDGSREKNFFAAPSAAGQSEVIASALRNANVRPRRVSYVEAHGTGTLVGDPIEFQGLCRVYAPDTPPLMKSPALKQAAESKLHARQWCGLGSVKGHIGHPNTAAGACALAKVLLMLRHKQLVPIANYKSPNPAIDFANSPFYPCTDLRHWAAPADGGPRTAALSAFGMGGTNAHVVLEEFAPEYGDRSSNKQWRENPKSQVNDFSHTQIKQRSSSSSSSNLLVVTGRTPRSLRDNLRRLKAYFDALASSSSDKRRKEVLADVSMTLLLGRHHFRERRWHAVVRSCDDAALRISRALEEAEKQRQTLHEKQSQTLHEEEEDQQKQQQNKHKKPKPLHPMRTSAKAEDQRPKVVLLFSGQGSQYPGMASGLYRSFPLFRTAIDRCSEILGYDVLSPNNNTENNTPHELQPPKQDSSRWAQVAVFCVSYALCRLLQGLGIQCHAAVGHSAGEYAAAVESGVMQLKQALLLLDRRGRIMDEMMEEGGGMMAVFASRETVEAWLGEAQRLAPESTGHVTGVGIACDNAPDRVVVSGKRESLLKFKSFAEARGARATLLKTSKAFHSPAVTLDMQWKFLVSARRLDLSKPSPSLPMLCNSTGGWLQPEDARDPARWVRAMRAPVRFRSNIETVLRGAREEAEAGFGSGRRVFVEVGPGKALASLARRHFDGGGSEEKKKRSQERRDTTNHTRRSSTHMQHLSVSLGRHPKDKSSDDVGAFLSALGALWKSDVRFDNLQALFGAGFRVSSRLPRRISLPTYAFDRQHCWVGPSDLELTKDKKTLTYRLQWREKKADEDEEAKAGATEDTRTRTETKIEWAVPVAAGYGYGGSSSTLSTLSLASFDLSDDDALERAVRGGRIALLEGDDRKEEAQTRANHATYACDFTVARQVLSLLHRISKIMDKHAHDHAKAKFFEEKERKKLSLLIALKTSASASTSRFGFRGGAAAAWGLAKVAALEYRAEIEVTRVLWDSEGALLSFMDAERGGKKVHAPEVRLVTSSSRNEFDGKNSGDRRSRGSSSVQFRLQVPRLTRLEMKGERKSNRLLRTDGVWVITGGTRGIGLRVAEWLVTKHNVSKVVLVGRSIPKQLAESPQVSHMKQKGASVVFEAADVTDTAALKSVLENATGGGSVALRGIVHSAGILDDGILSHTNADRMEKVIKVKSAAWALHTLTAECYPNQLDAMILFSSTSALFGVSGQGSYVAANTFLDWLSDYRTSKGSLTLSIQWGAWAETGMSVSSDLKELPGENHLKPTEALDALDEVMNHAFETFNSEKKKGAATAGANEIEMGAFTYPIFNVTDWNMYASNSNIFEQGPRGLVEELTGGVPVGVVKKGEGGQDGEENMLDFLLKNVSKDAAADSTSASLADLGFDSLDIINLRNKITQKFGATLPLDRFFDASLSVKSLYTELEGMRSSDK